MASPKYRESEALTGTVAIRLRDGIALTLIDTSAGHDARGPYSSEPSMAPHFRARRTALSGARLYVWSGSS
jgi:hypothetical protein